MVDSTYQPKVFKTDGGDSLKVASGGHIDVETGGELRIAGVAITATAAEINAAAGTGVSSTELDLLDGAIAGTAVASKALALGTDKNVDTLAIADSGLKLGAGAGTAVSATAAELNYNDITTLGTGAASKAVVLDAGEDYTWPAAGILTYGVLKDPAATTITSTGAEINLLDGSVVANTVASKAALVDSDKRLQTNSNNGTVEANVTAVHYGDGVNVTAVLTLTNVVLAVGNSENLGVGALIYTLPTGACLIRDSYMSVGFSGVSTTTDTPEIGLGTVIASGVVTALSGTATFEDIITGQVAADTNGTATVKGVAPTANVPLEITTAGAHTVHVNMADGWGANADQSGLLNGTVVLSFIRQAA